MKWKEIRERLNKIFEDDIIVDFIDLAPIDPSIEFCVVTDENGKAIAVYL